MPPYKIVHIGTARDYPETVFPGILQGGPDNFPRYSPSPQLGRHKGVKIVQKPLSLFFYTSCLCNECLDCDECVECCECGGCGGIRSSTTVFPSKP
jgi:hypothetical protein